MAALLDERFDSSIELIVSSKPDAYGLALARRRGVAVKCLDKKIDWQDLLKSLEERGITHIFLAGFMKVIPAEFLQQWGKPVLNVHPSLLPAYPGLNSIRRAYEENADMGVTVHKVIGDVDAGPVILQKKVFNAGEAANLSPEQAEFRVHLAEYELVRKALKAVSCWT